MIIKIENRNFIDELERLQNEVQSRQSIIAYMISSGVDIKSASFQEYQREYFDYFKKYDKKKEEVRLTYIAPNLTDEEAATKNWTLDFASGELTIR